MEGWKLPWAETFPSRGKVLCLSINPYRAAEMLQDVLVFLNVMPQKPAIMPFKNHLLGTRSDFLLLHGPRHVDGDRLGSPRQPRAARVRSKSYWSARSACSLAECLDRPEELTGRFVSKRCFWRRVCLFSASGWVQKLLSAGQPGVLCFKPLFASHLEMML